MGKVAQSRPRDRRARVVTFTQEGRRVAAAYFEKHAKDLEEVMSVLSDKEKRQVYRSLKKLWLHAAQRLSGTRTQVHEYANSSGKVAERIQSGNEIA